MAWSNPRRAQSSVEVMIALALFVLMTMAAFTLFGTTLSQDALSRERQTAQNAVQEGQEAVRQIRNADWDALTAGTHGLVLSGGMWSFNGTEDVQDIYHRSVVVTDVGNDARDVAVTVQWTSAGGGNATAAASARLTNWQAPPLPSGSNCNEASSSGNWANPVVIGSADIGAGNQGTDVVVNLPYVYVSGVAASASKPDLFVFDVSNPASPTLVGSIDIGSGGINALFLKGDYLYAASPNDSKELIVFDISAPTSTIEVASVNLPGSANALSVIVQDTLVAIARSQSSNDEIYFYNVTDPESPSQVGTENVAGAVNDFATSETYLYAITSAADEDIYTYDITDSLNPMLVSIFDLEDGTQDISIAYQDPGILFIGNQANLFIVIDASDPLQMVELASVGTNGEVRDVVCTVGDLAFLGTTSSNSEFQILNISDLDNVYLYASLNFPQMTGGVAFVDNKAYAAVRSNDALRIIGPGP